MPGPPASGITETRAAAAACLRPAAIRQEGGTAMAYAASADEIRPMTNEERKVIFASSLGTVFEWYDFYLYGSLLGGHRRAVLLGRQPDRGLHLRADGLRRRLRGPALRRAVLRSPRRHDRPQVHLPHHHPDHGPVDLHRRHPAQLRLDRHRRAGHPHLPPAAAGPRPRRRVRRCRDLRRRARAARTPRRLHLVDPDDGDPRPLPVAAGHPRLPRLDVARRSSTPGAGAFPSSSRSCCSASPSGSG